MAGLWYFAEDAKFRGICREGPIYLWNRWEIGKHNVRMVSKHWRVKISQEMWKILIKTKNNFVLRCRDGWYNLVCTTNSQPSQHEAHWLCFSKALKNWSLSFTMFFYLQVRLHRPFSSISHQCETTFRQATFVTRFYMAGHPGFTTFQVQLHRVCPFQWRQASWWPGLTCLQTSLTMIR